MLDKYLNPSSSKPFPYLHNKRLFPFGGRPAPSLPHLAADADVLQIQKPSEFFWLCENCSNRYTVLMEPDGSMRMVARLPANKRKTA